MSFYQDIGKAAVRRRRELNLNQQGVANKAGVSRMTMVRFEDGEPTSLDTIVRVAKALNCTARLVWEENE